LVKQSMFWPNQILDYHNDLSGVQQDSQAQECQ
jgi:hypothetical protein